MAHNRFFKMLIVLVLLGSILACATPSFLATPTPVPTSTPTPSLTATLPPTLTPRPSFTPNYTSTARYTEMYSFVQSLNSDGYIPSTKGTYNALKNFTDDWAQLAWYSWQTTGYEPADFVLQAHMAWDSASKTPNPSGCGVVFHIQDNNQHYVIFILTTGYLEFGISTDQFRNSGAAYYGGPASKGEADFAMSAVNDKFDVFINGVYIKTFHGLQGKMTDGALGFTVLSGTNAGFGTHCEVSDAKLWTIEK